MTEGDWARYRLLEGIEESSLGNQKQHREGRTGDFEVAQVEVWV